MRCEEARRVLMPEPGPRPESPESREAFDHYERCPACQQFFADHRAIRSRLSNLKDLAAPAALRRRVEEAIAKDSVSARPRRPARWIAAGGALVAAATLILVLSNPTIPETVRTPLVQHAAQALPDPTLADEATDAIATSDSQILGQWFVGRVNYPVEVPQIDGAELVGGRVAELHGVRSVSIVYRYRNSEITYFALPSGQVGSTTVDWNDIVAESSDGYELAMWQEAGLARAVVAAMPRADVMRFARECRAKALRSI